MYNANVWLEYVEKEVVVRKMSSELHSHAGACLHPRGGHDRSGLSSKYMQRDKADDVPTRRKFYTLPFNTK